MTDQSKEPKELRVLRAMKQTLMGIIRDTTVDPGVKHPLSDNTIEDIRQCLGLITSREQELGKELGIESNMKPRYADEPEKVVAIPVTKISRKDKDD